MKYFLATGPDSMDAHDSVSNISFFVSVFVSTMILSVYICLFFCALDMLLVMEESTPRLVSVYLHNYRQPFG